MMQRFRTLLLLSILAPLNTGAAAQAPSQSHITSHQVTPLTGLSLGVNTGFTHVSANTRWVNYIPGLMYNRPGQYATTATGGFMGAHAILGRVYPSQFYLSGEITGAVHNNPRGTIQDTAKYGLIFRYSIKDRYTAALRAGLVADRVLIYMKAGVALTRRKIESWYTTSQPLASLITSRKYRFAPMVGIGFDVGVNDRVSCGLESAYALDSSDRFTYPGGDSYKIKAETYDFKLKVTFKL
jgi:opacity protein-like surface antigen